MIRALLALATCLVTVAHAALAELPAAWPDPTVRAVLPGCRSLVQTEGVPASAEAAFCAGMVDALVYLGAILPADFCYAVPRGFRPIGSSKRLSRKSRTSIRR